MSEAPAIRLDAATALFRGGRALQEDAVLGAAVGATGAIALADGCGGHARGDLASNIAADVALRALARAEGSPAERLREAAEAANLAVYARAQGEPDLEGMSTTLLVVSVEAGGLHWVSVGDSPLWLMREGRLKRLNATHSLARQLDLLVQMGEMSPAEAADHPARACLTSALGGETIEEIDCPDAPVPLWPGDVILAASDGLLTLDETAIASVLSGAEDEVPANALAERLLAAVEAEGVEGQDNASVAVLRVEEAPAEPARTGRLGVAGKGALVAGLRRRAIAALAAAIGAGSSADGSRAAR
ncbi:MAG: protein phosphatase 2C domain-containing protein [Paracoccaceae bacterium]|jgi:serine/threonine protein phosphatase PrpC|nr:protein phosphatase 2C domain-containing protein [Paracoccaceae bacterium]